MSDYNGPYYKGESLVLSPSPAQHQVQPEEGELHNNNNNNNNTSSGSAAVFVNSNVTTMIASKATTALHEQDDDDDDYGEANDNFADHRTSSQQQLPSQQERLPNLQQQQQQTTPIKTKAATTPSTSDVNVLMSPFSKRLLQRLQQQQQQKQDHDTTTPHEDELSLHPCQKVSTVVYVQSPTTTLPQDTKKNGSTNATTTNNSSTAGSQMCLFPLLKETGLSPTMQSSFHRDMVVVNPSAFGKVIPSSMTMETARMVAQVANIQSEDWARLYRFSQILWPLNHRPPDPYNHHQHDSNNNNNNNTTTADTLQNESLFHLSIAMANDACYCKKSGKLDTNSSLPTKQQQQQQQNHNSIVASTTRLIIGTGPTDIHIRRSLLWGGKRQESSHHYHHHHDAYSYSSIQERNQKSSLLSTKNRRMVAILQHYGLLGTTLQSFLTKKPEYAVCALSAVEIIEDDAIYDIFTNEEVILRHQIRDGKGAIIAGGTELPVDSLACLDDLRDAILGNHNNNNNSNHNQHRSSNNNTKNNRNGRRGHVLVTLKIWQSAVQQDLQTRCTMLHFLDLWEKPNNPTEDTSTTMMAAASSPSPSVPSQKKRHVASMQQSISNLATILRSGKKNTILSYRDSLLTQVLQRALEDDSLRAVVLAKCSPLSEDYHKTMGTLRYLDRIMANSTGKSTPKSPFDGRAKKRAHHQQQKKQQQSSSSVTSIASSSHTTNSSMTASPQQPHFLGGGNRGEIPPGLKESLLRNVVGDPRQRLAMWYKPQTTRVNLEGYYNGDGVNTSYMVVDPELIHREVETTTTTLLHPTSPPPPLEDIATTREQAEPSPLHHQFPPTPLENQSPTHQGRQQQPQQQQQQPQQQPSYQEHDAAEPRLKRPTQDSAPLPAEQHLSMQQQQPPTLPRQHHEHNHHQQQQPQAVVVKHQQEERSPKQSLQLQPPPQPPYVRQTEQEREDSQSSSVQYAMPIYISASTDRANESTQQVARHNQSPQKAYYPIHHTDSQEFSLSDIVGPPSTKSSPRDEFDMRDPIVSAMEEHRLLMECELDSHLKDIRNISKGETSNTDLDDDEGATEELRKELEDLNHGTSPPKSQQQQQTTAGKSGIVDWINPDLDDTDELENDLMGTVEETMPQSTKKQLFNGEIGNSQSSPRQRQQRHDHRLESREVLTMESLSRFVPQDEQPFVAGFNNTDGDSQPPSPKQALNVQYAHLAGESEPDGNYSRKYEVSNQNFFGAIAVLEATINAIQEQVATDVWQINKDAIRRLREFQLEQQQLLVDLIGQRNAEAQKNKNGMETLENLLQQNKERLSHKDKEIETLGKLVETTRTECSELEKIAEDAITQRDRIQQKVDEMEMENEQSTIAQYDRVTEELMGELHSMKRALNKMEEERDEYKMKLNEANFRLDEAESERMVLNKRQEIHEVTLERMHHQDREQSSTSASMKVPRMQNEINSLRQQLSDFRVHREDRENEIQNELERRASSLSFSQHRISDLEEELSALRHREKNDVQTNYHELSLLREQVARLQLDLSEAKIQRDHEAERFKLELRQRESSALELERTKSNLNLRIKDMGQVSGSLHEALRDREELQAKVMAMENAFERYKEDTKERVQRVIHYQKEATELTLSENRELAETNARLQDVIGNLQKEREEMLDAQKDSTGRSILPLDIKIVLAEQENEALANTNIGLHQALSNACREREELRQIIDHSMMRSEQSTMKSTLVDLENNTLSISNQRLQETLHKIQNERDELRIQVAKINANETESRSMNQQLADENRKLQIQLTRAKKLEQRNEESTKLKRMNEVLVATNQRLKEQNEVLKLKQRENSGMAYSGGGGLRAIMPTIGGTASSTTSAQDASTGKLELMTDERRMLTDSNKKLHRRLEALKRDYKELEQERDELNKVLQGNEKEKKVDHVLNLKGGKIRHVKLTPMNSSMPRLTSHSACVGDDDDLMRDDDYEDANEEEDNSDNDNDGYGVSQDSEDDIENNDIDNSGVLDDGIGRRADTANTSGDDDDDDEDGEGPPPACLVSSSSAMPFDAEKLAASLAVKTVEAARRNRTIPPLSPVNHSEDYQMTGRSKAAELKRRLLRLENTLSGDVP